jgi:uncharacterized membrane protein YbhN (UPF0104 family)
MVMRALKCPSNLATTTRITFVGAFFNQFLPTSIGSDAVRIWESFRSGFDLAKTVDSVLLERAGYVLSISLLAALGAATWDQGQLPAGAVPALWLVFGAGLVAMLALGFVDRISPRLLPEVIAKSTATLANDARALLSSPRPLATVFATAVVNQALLVVALLLIADDIGVRLDPIACASLLPAVVLVGSLPISIAGWGVRDYAMVTAFGFAGVPAAAALVFSLILAILSVVAALPGAVLWLTRRRGAPA